MTEQRLGSPLVPILIGLVAAGIFFLASRVLLLPYPLKSAIKAIVFIVLPLGYWLVAKPEPLTDTLRRMLPRRTQLPQLAVIGLVGAVLIVLVTVLLEPIAGLLGLDSLLDWIRADNTITRPQMLRRIFYIPTINNFAEEFLFRFFLLGTLIGIGYQKLALFASAAIFSIYHIGIFETWFDPLQMAGVLLLLFAFGLALNFKARRDNHLAGVLLIHGLINIASMTITLQLYD